MRHVLIIGGGVAGLSAAHELVRRGYKVTVSEKQGIAGGKARSMGVPGSGKDGRKDLPGEHGFRFFPGFYKHIIDTLRQIPFNSQKGRNTVFDNLVNVKTGRLSLMGMPDQRMQFGLPKTKKQLKEMLALFFNPSYGLTDAEVEHVFSKLWQFLTSCKERRNTEYEKISWWNYIEAEAHSTNFRKTLVEQTRSLVAAKPKEISAKTSMQMFSEIFFGLFDIKNYTDRILNGPTNAVWIDPWIEYLETFDFEYRYEQEVNEIQMFDNKVNAVIATSKHGEPVKLAADYYLFAVPVEAMARLLNEDLVKKDRQLGELKELAKQVEWMNGIQYFLEEDVELSRGHINFISSPWALTAISQVQFWPDFRPEEYGNGRIKGILSVDISDWNTPGIRIKKKASECNALEIAQEVWYQMQESLNDDRRVLLKDDGYSRFFIDPDINISAQGGIVSNSNAEPLLVNHPDSWKLRPEVSGKIENMFLAADYVRTNSDLACMETANEAAKRAVNSILEKDGFAGEMCKIYEFREPFWLDPYKTIDQKRYKQGKAWSGKFPWLFSKLIRRLNPDPS